MSFFVAVAAAISTNFSTDLRLILDLELVTLGCLAWAWLLELAGVSWGLVDVSKEAMK